MSLRFHLTAIVFCVIFIGLILELIRRRKLKEEYALLWLLTGITILALACLPFALDNLAQLIGTISPANALFIIGITSLFLIVLHFSLVISALSEQNKEFAQHLALLSWQVQELSKQHGLPLASGTSQEGVGLDGDGRENVPFASGTSQEGVGLDGDGRENVP